MAREENFNPHFSAACFSSRAWAFFSSWVPLKFTKSTASTASKPSSAAFSTHPKGVSSPFWMAL